MLFEQAELVSLTMLDDGCKNFYALCLICCFDCSGSILFYVVLLSRHI